jgi:SAM-dependent methyltransferase
MPSSKKHLMHQYNTPDYAALAAPHVPLLHAALALATPAGARLALDLGCGTGTWTPWLRAACEPGALVVGLDHASAGLATTVGGPWLVGDAQRLPLRPAVADLVWCVAALSLFGDPAQALREVRRVLRPGGALVVTVAGERWVRLRRRPPGAVPGQASVPLSPADGLGDELRTALGSAGFGVSRLAAYLLDPPGCAPLAAQLPLAELDGSAPLEPGEPEPRAVLLVATGVR